MGVVTKRSSMTFFSDSNCHYCHRVRIVLEEKGVSADLIESDSLNPPTEVREINPYGSLPTLIDRDLILYESKVIMEYLDERFPHPPLLPVYPVARAESRLFIYRIERDWSALVDSIFNSRSENVIKKAVKELREGVVAISPIFSETPYFMSDEFTLVDCCLAPILWRLPHLGIDIKPTKQTKPLFEYMERLFSRESFVQALSEQEREMRH